MKMARYAYLVLFLLLAWSAGTVASEKSTDPYKVVTSAELKALVDNKFPGLVIIDARSPEEFQEVHISGALSIPLPKLEKDATLLKSPKDAKLVFYCNGVKCGKSGKSAKIAIDNGFRDVSVYAEGMPVWEEKGFPMNTGPDYAKKVATIRLKPAELKALLEQKPDTITLVDVREPDEFAAGHIPGAINLPLANFAAGSGVLDKGKRIVVYCNTGNRSYSAYRKLQKLAYPAIGEAVFSDWKLEGHTVVK